METPAKQNSIDYEDGQVPLLLSFLGIVIFSDFRFEREYVSLRPKNDVTSDLLELFLHFLRSSTGKEFFFEIDGESHQLLLKCLTDKQYFPKMLQQVKQSKK